MVYHKDMSYFLSWTGMREAGSLEPKPGLPPTPAHLARLLERMQREPAKAVVYSPYNSPDAARFLSERAGIPAIAMSQALRDQGHGFSAAEGWAVRVLKPLIDVPMPKRTLINVNFPALASGDVRGVRIARQAFHDYARGSVVESTDPRGRPYFWFGLEDVEHTLDHGTDLEAVNDGYVSVTPLQLDLTHYASLGVLAERFG